jgi:hypothetical protein
MQKFQFFFSLTVLVQLVGELEDDLLDLLHTVPVQMAGLFLQGLQCFPQQIKRAGPELVLVPLISNTILLKLRNLSL